MVQNFSATDAGPLHPQALTSILRTVRLLMMLSGFLSLSAAVQAASTIHEFRLNSIDGQPTSLAQFKGKVVLVVNVASKCGFTPQYAGLEALYEKYKERGFVVLGFPANNFLWQEPGTNEEIKAFCTRKYNVTFPMFAKVSVKGRDKTPLYRFLTDTKANPATGGEIAWNFTKFLVDRNGKVIARFSSSVRPDAPELLRALEEALR